MRSRAPGRITPVDQRKLKKLVILALVAGLAATFFATGMHAYLTLDAIKASQARLQGFYGQHPATLVALFALFYIPVIALNLPGATVLGLAAGAIFGALPGTVVVSFASTVGATLACLLSRYLLRDWVQKKFADRLRKVNAGIRKEGAFYLFSMRLIPVIPFFVINLVMGLTPMRLWTFYWVSQLGMLPGTAIYVNAGSQIARIDSPGGIVSANLIASLALLGLFPLAARKILNAYRRRAESGRADAPESEMRPPDGSEAIRRERDQLLSQCTDCGACKRQCAFLDQYGTPGEIAAGLNFSKPEYWKIAFECSLCGLCAAVCPEKAEPGHLFLSLRREAVASRQVNLSPYKAILGYEKRGTSPLFSYYALPEGCDTVFFPGCTLPGTRPETTWRLFRHLQEVIPSLGIVLDCCTKPSHDLGRQGHFESMFAEMRRYLAGNGVGEVLVACPNCHKIFKSYGDGLKVRTVYEVISAGNLPVGPSAEGELALHDPCPLRGETGVHDAARDILKRIGLSVAEMRHRRRRTLCCGEGGSVGFVRPELARKWERKRLDEANGKKVVTYCAGCAAFLSRGISTVHLTDVLFFADKALNGGLRVTRSPFTYIQRLKLKRRFKRALRPAVERVRPRRAQALPKRVRQGAASGWLNAVLARKR